MPPDVPQVIQQVQIGWGGFVITLAGFIGLLFLRRLLPPDRKKRGRVGLAMLALSLVLRLGAGGLRAMAEGGPGGVLAFLAILLMAFGFTALVALLVFDILLARLRVRIPELVRDLLQALAFAIIIVAILP